MKKCLLHTFSQIDLHQWHIHICDHLKYPCFSCFSTVYTCTYLSPSFSSMLRSLSITRPTVSAWRCGEWAMLPGNRNICNHRSNKLNWYIRILPSLLLSCIKLKSLFILLLKVYVEKRWTEQHSYIYHKVNVHNIQSAQFIFQHQGGQRPKWNTRQKTWQHTDTCTHVCKKRIHT